MLPHTYQVPPEPPPEPHAHARAPPPPPPAALSVIARGPLLGAFVRASRLHPLSLAQWLDTLRRAPGARLLLLHDSAAARRATKASCYVDTVLSILRWATSPPHA